MKSFFIILSIIFAFMTPTLVHAADAVSPKAYAIGHILGLPITNSMVTGWMISLLLIIAIRLAVGHNPKLIPTKPQLIIESLIINIRNVVEPIVGPKMIGPTFPLLLAFFIFILINNLSGLLPGVGTFGTYDSHGHLLYYFRPANADLNMTLGLAIVSMAAWVYYVFRYEGFKSFTHHIFGNKANASEVPFVIYTFLFFIFFLVGIIECISILFRLVSLSFRLYGNVFGGENLLSAMHGIFKYILPVPFYFLEVLIGSIQAFVFMLLVAVYIGLVCNHDEEHPQTTF